MKKHILKKTDIIFPARMDQVVILLTHADISVKSLDKFKAITRTLWFFPWAAMGFFSQRANVPQKWAIKKTNKNK